MKKIMLGMIAVLIACALISCSPSGGTGPIIIGGNGGSGTEAALTDVAKNIDEGKALIDAMNDAEGTDIGYLNGPASASIMALSADDTPTAGSKTVYIRVTFSGYDNGSCTINSGHIDYTLTVNAGSTVTTNNDVAYTASASNLSVSVSGSSRGSITVTGTGLAGTISEISATATAEGSVELEISQNAVSTPSKTQGSYSSGNTTVSNAEASGAAEGGDGTEANPYEISTAEQLIDLPNLALTEGTTYVEIVNDIQLPSDATIGAIDDFHIEGAGNGIRLSFITSASGKNAVYLFTKATDTTLSNIIYEIYEPKILFSDVYGTMVLDKITAEGSITFNNSNISAFISYTNWGSTAPCTVTFRECVNSVDFTDMGNNYGAPFVAFSSGDTDFVFDSCRNEGNLFYGNWASILIGNANPGQGFPKSVEIKNSFVNTGTISSFGTIAFCSHNKDTDEKVIGRNLVQGFDENVMHLENSGMTLSATENGSWKITVDAGLSEKIAKVELFGHLYISIQDSTGKEVMHYAHYNFPIATAASESDFVFTKPESFKVIGSKNYTGPAAETNTIVEQNGQKYWFVDSPYDEYETSAGQNSTDGTAEFAKYYIIGYDANGKAVAKVSDITLPTT